MLLDGPQALTVFPQEASTDDLGNPVFTPSEESVEVVGQVQPLTAEEAAQYDKQGRTLYRYIGRDFPLGPFSRVTWNGRDWDVIGDPERTVGSIHTTHVTVVLRARKAEGT